MIRAGSARWCPAFDGRSYISDQKRNYLAADKVPRASKGAARFFVGGILWRFCFIFFRIFCFVYLRQYLNKNIYRFTSDTNQTPDVGALRCAGGGVGADYRLPVPQRPTTTRFFALPLKLIPPVSIDFTAVYSPSTCYWHVSVSLISFIKKKLFNCSDLNYFYFNFQSFSKYFFKALQFKLIKKNVCKFTDMRFACQTSVILLEEKKKFGNNRFTVPPPIVSLNVIYLDMAVIVIMISFSLAFSETAALWFIHEGFFHSLKREREKQVTWRCSPTWWMPHLDPSTETMDLRSSCPVTHSFSGLWNQVNSFRGFFVSKKFFNW